MPCLHKFHQYLQLNSIDFEPETFIVGTFFPAWPASNCDWFYGRTNANYFWDILPRLYGETSLINATPAEWKQFCKRHKIALTDLITCIDDANENKPAHQKVLGGYADKALIYNFEDFVFTDVLQLLKQHSSVKNVYLTRGITETYWRHLWNPVAIHCNRNQLHERRLLSPTDEALFHHGMYNDQNTDALIPRVEDYVLMRWREEWHF